MAKCNICGKEKGKSVGCDWASFEIDGRSYERVRYGDEIAAGAQETPWCHDCGTPVGGFHHPGCAVEECPLCKKTVQSCECDM